MERFGISGLWKHAGSSFTAAALLVADGSLSYLNVVSLPAWAHGLVAVAILVLGSYKGKPGGVVGSQIGG